MKVLLEGVFWIHGSLSAWNPSHQSEERVTHTGTQVPGVDLHVYLVQMCVISYSVCKASSVDCQKQSQN